MNIRTRSFLMTGAAILSASIVAVPQSVQSPPPPRPAPVVHLAPEVQLVALTQQQPLLTVLLNSPQQLLGPAAPLGELPSPPVTPLAVPIAPNLANTIDGIYTAVEPWVRYGFEVATAVVRWIPYVGWFAGQIMVLYNFGESMVASGVFNFTDWLRGNGGIAENLVDFGVDVGLAFVWLGLDEVAQFVPLPPFCCYPPRPPVQGPFLAAADTLAAPTETGDLTAAKSLVGVTNPADSEQVGEDVSAGPVDGTKVTGQDAGQVDNQATDNQAVDNQAVGAQEADSSQGETQQDQNQEEAVAIDNAAKDAAKTEETGQTALADSADNVEAQGQVTDSDTQKPTGKDTGAVAQDNDATGADGAEATGTTAAGVDATGTTGAAGDATDPDPAADHGGQQ